MLNNIIAAAVAQIMNAGASRKLMVVLKNCSVLLENILVCLKENGYINDFKKFTHDNKITIIVKLSYYKPSNIEYMKNYMKDYTISEFFELHKDKMFDMNQKISVPVVPSYYKHSIKKINNKSTGGRVMFAGYKNLPEYREKTNSFGMLILTTSKGVLSHVDAIKQQVGGKILLGVY